MGKLNGALQGPARRVALAGAAILILLVAAVGVTLWRYGIATREAHVAARNQNAARLVNQGNDFLLERSVLIEAGRPLTPARRIQLRTEERDFDRAMAGVQRAWSGSPEERRLRASVMSANERSLTIERRLLPRLDAPGAERGVRRLRAALVAVNHRIDPLTEVSTTQATAATARSWAAERSARAAGIVVGALAFLVTLGLVLYAVRLLRRIFDRIRDTLGTLTEASLEMGAAAQESAAATSQQSAGIAEAAATIDELSTTAASISATAQTSASAALQTGETMVGMQAQVALIAERSLELGQGSQEIREILSLINEIAEQTNLLALNAAIEAARAGDAGRGFAVVASEVRKLAERSVDSTGSIRDIVASVQNKTNATILATERGSAQAGEVVELMRTTGEELEESLRATEQQTQAADQVALAMGEIRSAAEQLSAEQDERLQTTKRVEELVGELEHLLESHGVPVRNGRAPVRALA